MPEMALAKPLTDAENLKSGLHKVCPQVALGDCTTCTRSRQVIKGPSMELSQTQNQEGLDEGYVGMCEMDSHAHTCCLGMNFVPTYKVCNVAPFLSKLPRQEGVQICSEATAFDDGNGGTYILVINQTLWFGEKMQHTLINPNQVRAFGVSLCDDPTDPNCQLGMTIQDTSIPFTMMGTTYSFITRTPMSWELDNCPHF